MAEPCVKETTVDNSRKSSYPMIDVDNAIAIILQQTSITQQEVLLSLSKAYGHIVSQDFMASDPFPAFPASIMDGYAVIGPLSPGVYYVYDRIHAGGLPLDLTDSKYISYITTGAMLPAGANAVVKIEDTEIIESSSSSSSGEKVVKINVSIQSGENVRQIGSDIKAGEIVLKKGERIGPAELGLLATIGLTQVPCFKKPIIGIMSTGSELVDVSDMPIGSQIRDSNRPTLLAAFAEDGYECVDLGIICDQENDLRDALLDASLRCDVVVTSGGVSMGEKDYVKPLLAEIGNIHFGRLNMKPGKPTTFASLSVGSKKVFFFGLPGNPVSCLVTKSLLIDPCLKRMQGLDSSQCMHPQILAKLQGTTIHLDPERPEYHRVIASYDITQQTLIVQSTGNQRSSRLLSMKSANGLICLPKGSGQVKPGDEVITLLLRPLPYPQLPEFSFHRNAATVDYPERRMNVSKPISSSVETTSIQDIVNRVDLIPKSTKSGYESFEDMLKSSNTLLNSTSSVSKSMGDEKGSEWRSITVGILTISDRAYTGIYKDESGPEISKILDLMSVDPTWPLTTRIVNTAIVPDDIEKIQAKIKEWTVSTSSSTSMSTNGVDMILTTGGTGFGPRDLTPEAIKPLLHREAPGVAQALLSEGLKYTPLAVMSRPVVGTINETLLCTLPGSVKAVRENIHALKPLLPRMMELIKSGTCEMHKKST